ncbi:MAG: exosortase/archaeosortase family protein [Candidatus Diapherotrites archaeon]|nr:exosortase/archaeosortase family protein [Candidatus Diapherotrites archaeon]
MRNKKRKLNFGDDDRKRELYFLLKFFLIYGALQTIIYFADVAFVTNWIASFEASLFSLQSQGNTIRSGTVVFVINNSCTGLVSISVLAAIVFSFRRPSLKEKIMVFLPCSAILFLVNLARVYAVIYAGVHINHNLVEPLHISSWFLMSGAIVILWYFGTKKFAKIKYFKELL